MKNKQPPSFLTQHESEEKVRWEALEREREATSRVIFKVLEEMSYIGKLVGHQEITSVKDIKERIDAAYERIQEYLSGQQQELEEEQAMRRKRGGDEIPIEKNPLLEEMGGMPLELDKLDKAWLKELNLDSKNVLDKAELRNQIRDKLQNKLKNALKLANTLKNRLAASPNPKAKQEQVQKMTIKYQQTLELLNRPILQPEAPELRPGWTPPAPKPFG